MTTQTDTTWRLKGTIVVACNCDYGCPCNFNAMPTQGNCEGGWTWHIDEGQYGDVRLDGLNFSAFADWPGAIHEGDGEVLFLIDERANDAQREAITNLLGGKVGGPWGILVNTWTSVHGPELVPYELKLDGDRSTVRAGDSMELELEPIRNPVTGAEVHPRILLPEGFVFKDGSMMASRAFSVRDGVSYDHSGKYAAFAPFDYEGRKEVAT